MKHFLLVAAVAALAVPARAQIFQQSNLVSDGSVPAATIDPNLVNPWGISASSTGPFWVSDNNTNVSTLYNTAGQSYPVGSPLVVGVSNPTGQVFSGGAGFAGTGGSPNFIFAGDNGGVSTGSGTVSAWFGSGNAAVQFTGPSGSSYTGVAIGTSGASAPTLYLADSGLGKISTLGSTFASSAVTGSFIDPSLPAGNVPFNIQRYGTTLYVAYANFGNGGGAVASFDENGNFISQIADNGSTGPLDLPWGLDIAPAGFGPYGGDLLVGNLGNGEINVFDPTGAGYLGTIDVAPGVPFQEASLWGLINGNGGKGGNTNTVYFAAGLSGENGGLFGALSVPEPSTGVVLGGGVAALLTARRRR